MEAGAASATVNVRGGVNSVDGRVISGEGANPHGIRIHVNRGERGG